MEQIFKELVEIDYVFPAETEFVSSKNGLKVNVFKRARTHRL